MEEICEVDIDKLQTLYYLYEFTDDIIFLSQPISNYPTIDNFVRTGILTEEESYDALLYQKS